MATYGNLVFRSPVKNYHGRGNPWGQYGKAGKSTWQETFSFFGAFVFQDCCFWTFFKLGQMPNIIHQSVVACGFDKAFLSPSAQKCLESNLGRNFHLVNFSTCMTCGMTVTLYLPVFRPIWWISQVFGSQFRQHFKVNCAKQGLGSDSSARKEPLKIKNTIADLQKELHFLCSFTSI